MSGEHTPLDVEFPPGHGWSEDEQRPVYVFYTASETADILGVSERTIRRKIASGQLEAVKEGGEFRIDLDAARAALVGLRGRPTVSLVDRIAWLERENERLWALLEKAVS